jgi:hypothetical protein
MAFGFDDAIAAGLKVLDKFIPDPEAKAKAEAELRSSLMAWDVAQTEINRAEALHKSIFISGWRPFIGWTCGVAFAYHFVVSPLIVFAMNVSGKMIDLPVFPMETLLTVLMGMLGFGGLRTFEKMRGLTK